MKNTTRYLFADDGYPEAEEYETNYIPWDAHIPGSCEKAVAEAKERLKSRRKSRRLPGLDFRKLLRAS
jgi:hypothetical protein